MAYVDKAKLMQRIETEAFRWGEEYDLSQIMGDIEDFPESDVEEVRHSRWENISGFDVCNICGTSPAYCEPKPNSPKGYPPYCHNCGAKMDGKDETDDA